jgi:hypothetical protein
MPSAPGTARENIQAQGFCGLDDSTCRQINYPLRLSPAICMAWAAVGTALASPTILWALVPFAALGAILPGHPFRQACPWSAMSSAGRSWRLLSST